MHELLYIFLELKKVKINIFKLMRESKNGQNMFIFMLIIFIYTIKIIFRKIFINIMLLVDIYKVK